MKHRKSITSLFPQLFIPSGLLLCLSLHLHLHRGRGCFHSWGVHNACPESVVEEDKGRNVTNLM